MLHKIVFRARIHLVMILDAKLECWFWMEGLEGDDAMRIAW